MPPKVRHQADSFDDFIRVFGVQFDVDGVHVGKAFEDSTTLPSITGFDASAPRLPSPRMAVPLVITATMFPLTV